MRTTKVARLTVIGGGLVTTGVLALASALQSAPTSFEQTRTALAQRFVAAVPNAFAPETIPVKKKPVSADSVVRNGAAPVRTEQEVRKLNSVIVTGAMRLDSVQNPIPTYPYALQAAQIEGAVIARFTYDARGMVEPATISILTSTDGLLSESVRAAVARWRGPANSIAQVPFIFVLDTKTGKDLAAYPGGLPEGSMVIKGTTAIRAESVVGNGSPGPLPVNENQTYFEFQVEKQVQPLPGNPGPRYPDLLRSANVEGEVLAQFVVGPDGVADMSTFKVLKSTHELFTESVVKTLPNMRFSAPEVGGRAVKQLVQMPFQFSLGKTP